MAVGGTPITLIGMKKKVKDDKVSCYVAFSCKKDDYNSDFIGEEAATCKISEDIYNELCKHKIGDKLKGVITRENFSLKLLAILD